MMINKKSGGFTLVELMAAMVISTILALTGGLMLYHASVAWRKDSEAVELQRDATFAMDIISRAIRPATHSDIDIQNSGLTLIIGNKAFYLQGSASLEYDPDDTVSGDETIIINNKVSGLSFLQHAPSRSIRVNLVLADGAETTALDTVVRYRN